SLRLRKARCKPPRNPTYEEIPKSCKKYVVNKLEEEIKKAQKLEDLLVHLLSTELIADKDLPKLAPMCVYIDSGNHRERVKMWGFFWYRVQTKACIQQKVQALQISSKLLLSSEDEAKHANPNMKLSKSAKSDNDRTTEPSSTEMRSQQTPPTYEESTQDVMKKYAKQVEQAKTPEDLLEPLLSGISIHEKRKLIQNVPDVTRLENVNFDELAQRVVYRYHLLNTSSDRDWCKELITLDITLRWIVQRRIWLEQEAKALQTCQTEYMSNSDLYKLDAYEKQIKSLNSRYWDSHREHWAKSDGIWSMLASRATKRQGKHADWYLSGVLREDGANRGGCCGQMWMLREATNDYGVCGRGHCTTACSCYLKAHNIDGEKLEMKDVNEVHFTSLNSLATLCDYSRDISSI
ncbi:hypothetical protein N7537_000623, partial [Penicillium hordei]